MAVFVYPGVLTITTLVCNYENLVSQPVSTGGYFTICSSESRNRHFSLDHNTIGLMGVVFDVVVVLLPILVVLTCMIVQLKYIRRTFQDTEARLRCSDPPTSELYTV